MHRGHLPYYVWGIFDPLTYEVGGDFVPSLGKYGFHLSPKAKTFRLAKCANESREFKVFSKVDWFQRGAKEAIAILNKILN